MPSDVQALIYYHIQWLSITNQHYRDFENHHHEDVSSYLKIVIQAPRTMGIDFPE